MCDFYWHLSVHRNVLFANRSGLRMGGKRIWIANAKCPMIQNVYKQTWIVHSNQLCDFLNVHPALAWQRQDRFFPNQRLGE